MKSKIYRLLNSDKLALAGYLFGAFASVFFIASYHWEPALKHVVFLKIPGVFLFAFISLIPAVYNLIRLFYLRFRKNSTPKEEKIHFSHILHFIITFIGFGMFVYGLLIFLRVGGGISKDELDDIMFALAMMSPVILLSMGIPALLFIPYFKSKAKKIICSVISLTLCIVTAVSFVPAVSSYVSEYYIRSDYSGIELPDGFEDKLNADVFENTADVRILLTNLLYENQDNPAKPRAKKFISLVNAYLPDVICVQEMSPWWCSLITNNLLNNTSYEMTHPIGYYAAKFEIALIYNTDTLDLIDSGSFRYTAGNGFQRLAWGVFEVKATGKRFIATSTHYSFLTAGDEENGLKITHSEADEMLKMIDKLEKKYNCPTFAAGDYNTRDDIYVTGQYSEIYTELTKVFKDSKYNCEKAMVGDAKDHLDEVKNEDCKTLDVADIDHIFFRGEAEAKTYINMSYTYLDDMSDHYPVLTDMVLK